MGLEWLDEIERRANAATPGPWRACTWDPMERPHVTVSLPDGAVCEARHDVPRTAADAEFIAHASEDVPLLCRAVRELYVALREMLDAYSDMARLEEWAEDAPEPPPALERAHDRWIEARRQAKRVLERWGRGGT